MTAEEVRQIIGTAVYFMTRPPHCGEFRWVLYVRQTGVVVGEGYARGLDAAMAIADLRRQQIAREGIA